MGCASTKPDSTNQQRDPSGAKKSGDKGKKESTLPQKATGAGGVGRAQFILDNQGKILEIYEVEKKKLGEGSYGSVCKAKHKTTGQVRAVKSIAKAQMKNHERFKQEIAIMKIMDHPNIIKLYETFEDHRNIYLIMELCIGGELFDRIIEAGHFTEVQAATLMQQIVKAIFFMHESHICHRDLKPENFLFSSKEKIEKSPLKIIDFGLSCQFKPGQVLTTKAGTPYYVAPQVLAGKYDQLSDLWSVGVIMYVMLCGYPPFFGETDAEVLSKVRLGNFSFNAADWKNVSEDAKNLIRMLLKMNPKERYNAEQALHHEWIAKKAPKAKDVNLKEDFVDNLRGFRSQNKLKKAALQVIAANLNDDQIKALRDIFMQLDGNGDGSLTCEEMKNGITKAGIKDLPSDLEQILKDVDSDGSGIIDYTEFLAATMDRRQYMKEDVCWTAFRAFDKNNDGNISKEELQLVLSDGDVGNVVTEQMKKEIEDIMTNDANGDGMISFEEFCAMMKKE